MTLSDLASIGSFVSAIAVVFSVLFLSLQLRQSNKNQKSLMQQGRSARTVDILMKMTEPVLSETIVNAIRVDAAKDPAKIFAFYAFACACFWNYEDSFLQFQAKTLDARSWATDDLTLTGLLRNPAYRAAWKLARNGMSGDYRGYIDAKMKEVKGNESRDIAELWNKYINEEHAAV